MTRTQQTPYSLKDFAGAFPLDGKAVENAFKNTAQLSEKLASVVLDAAEKSTNISGRWTKDTLSKMSDVAKVKEDPADYAKAMTDFASAQAESAAANMAAFAEVAKQVQMETVELLMAAGKVATDEATTAVRKATEEVSTAARKATASTK
ncbi:MAG: phasin family protein [Rhodobacteraceae bacterium]|nr:phasin family protein [Paracoccaceae bacterium]